MAAQTHQQILKMSALYCPCPRPPFGFTSTCFVDILSQITNVRSTDFRLGKPQRFHPLLSSEDYVLVSSTKIGSFFTRIKRVFQMLNSYRNCGSGSGMKSPLSAMSAHFLCQESTPIDYLWQATCSTLGVMLNFDTAQHFSAKRKEFAAPLYEVT